MSGLSADTGIASTLDMEAVLNSVMNSAVEILKAEAGLLLLLEETEDGSAALVFRVVSGPIPPSLVGRRLPVDKGIVGEVVRTGQGRYSNDPHNDAHWFSALDVLTGYETRAIICVPLKNRDRSIGALEVLNRLEPAPFVDEDVELLSAFAAQAAIALENARRYQEISQLYEQTDRALSKRLRELSIIEEIDRELGSSLNYDRSIDFVLERAIEACGASSGGIGILLPEGQRMDVRLWLGGESVALIADQWPVGRGIIGRVAQSGELALIDDALADPECETIADASRSVLAVPIRREEWVSGVLSLESERVAAFVPDDVRFLAHLADHAGIAIENARLFEQTDERLQARIDELTFLQRTTQEINATLALDRILKTVLELALQNTGATHGEAMLINLTTGDMTLRAAMGYTPAEKASAERSLQQPEAGSIALQVAESGQARLVEDAERESCVVCARLDTRSALIVPIVTEGLIIGLVNLYHTQVAAFDRNNLDFVQSLAQQAALAIGNAMRFEDQVRSNDALRRRNEQMKSLLAVSQEIRADVPLESALEEVAYAIQETVGFNVVLISVVEGAESTVPMLRRVAAAGLPLDLFEQAKQVRQPLALYEQLFRERYRQGQCYFFPFQERDEWGAELHTIAPMPETEEWRAGEWHRHDMLVVPLRGAGGRLLGHISVDEPQDGRRPSRPTLEALAVFANQAAAAVENARLFDAARRRVAELATVNQIGQAISSALDVDQLSELIYSQVSSLLDSRSFFIALYDRESEMISIEFSVEEGQRQPLLRLQLGQGLTSYLLTTGQGLLLTQGVEDFIRAHNLTLEGLPAKSWLGVPMIAEDRVIGAIAVQSYDREHAFDEEHLELLMTIAGQAAVAFQNASLFEERERRISELAVLNEMTQAVGSTLELDALLELVYKQVEQLVDATNFYIALYDRDKDEITFPFTVDPEQRGDWRPRKGGVGLTGRIIESGEPLLLPRGAAGLYQETGREVGEVASKKVT
mgnify:CR=1 FL=1